MGKDKLKRFAENELLPNVFQLDPQHKGKWNKDYFKNDLPIVLELGCGRGEYTISMANYFPEKNFIGIDIKGARLWRGAKTAFEEKMDHVAFIRMQIESLTDYFSPEEVSEIWITFPDPQPQISREKKRLTSPRFIEYYRSLLKKGGTVNLKTDNDGLYEYTLEKIKEQNLNLLLSTNDLYHSDILNEVLSIKTKYEQVYLSQGKNINYIKFSF